MEVVTFLLLLYYFFASVKSQPSPCPTSSGAGSGRVFTPNISDHYFSINNTASLPREPLNITGGGKMSTYFYSVLPLLPVKPECGSVDVVLEFCYEAVDMPYKRERRIFGFLYATQQQLQFTVTDTVRVMSKPGPQICSSGEGRLICCDCLALSKWEFGISSSRLVYGIRTNRLPRPLAFKGVVSDLEVMQYKTLSKSGSVFNTARMDGSLPLLRLSLVTRPNPPGNRRDRIQVRPTSTSPLLEGKNSSQIKQEDSPNVGLLLGVLAGGFVPLALLLAGTCVALVLLRRRQHKRLRLTIRSEMQQGSEYITMCTTGNTGGGATQPLSMQGHDHIYVGPKDVIEMPEVDYAQIKEMNNYAECGASCGEDYEVPVDQSLQTQTTSFGSDDIYMVPASDELTLHCQLDDFKIRNLPRDSVRLGDSLGSGQFGEVYRGEWARDEDMVEVAVKTLKEGAGEEDRVKFLQEAAIMGQFKHHNLVTMHGVVLAEKEILLVLELLPKGDLRDHLRSTRSNDGKVSLDDHTLLSYCRQVASGMAYLSNKCFVHRDLAARNVLVSADEICKIADFGMSRDLLCETYYVSHGGIVPVKWTAPEALYYKKFSTASDVWSYAVLAYEIWSVGQSPFKNIANNEVIRAIDSGVRLAPPPGCPRSLYTIMIACWHPNSSKRPSFMDLSRQLSLPDSKLLQWSEEDRSIHPEAAKLGSDLPSAKDLYKDLQTTYKT